MTNDSKRKPLTLPQKLAEIRTRLRKLESEIIVLKKHSWETRPMIEKIESAHERLVSAELDLREVLK